VPDLLQNLLFSGGGLAVGFILGRWERHANAGKPIRERWRDIAQTLLGLVIVALVVVTFWQQQSQTECHRAYFAGVSQSLADRTAASAGDRASNLEVIRAQKELLATQNPGRDPGIAAAALGRYVDALTAQEQALLALSDAATRSPIPQPPDC
jgi:hypothetical protein